ncbi:hypothetical protein [Klebsiella aerogenes]|uniref:hypothetical protein n=1 Tax=Klebsiella aerogenes TaxID=548 RepID=UPI001D186C70|nr:hypothetical protein [Klebsiella aerogenes]
MIDANKSTITKERLQEIAEDGFLKHGESKELARMAMVAMDNDSQEYPETLPCPVLLEPGMCFGKGVKTKLVLDALQRRAEHYKALEAMTPEERAEYDTGIEAFKSMLSQPAPVANAAPVMPLVPDEIEPDHENTYDYVDGWNSCRAAMLVSKSQGLNEVGKLKIRQEIDMGSRITNHRFKI